MRYDECGCGKRKQRTSACCRSCNSAGSANGNWRGGKTYHKAGYVMVWCPNHPRVTFPHSPYVFEHVLVMEEALGRYLWPDENVHHKNGVKDDNRLENLELWVKPQPSGVRVDDALAWAHEILARYGGNSYPAAL